MTAATAAIDPTARIEPGAAIGQGVTIGPYCTIGANVSIGDGCRLVAQVHLSGHTIIGPRTVIYPFVSLGSPPQSVRYRGGATRLLIGADCDIRENVTMNTGTEDGGGVTTVGDHCFLMAGSHVAHDCHVGNNVTFANNAVIGGHCIVGDNVVFGGTSAVRQFVRIGEGAMISGLSGAVADVIPWGMAVGRPAHLYGLNVIGMRRGGHDKAAIHQVREAYRELFFGQGVFRDRFERVQANYAASPLVGKIVDFVRARKKAITMAYGDSEAYEDR